MNEAIAERFKQGDLARAYDLCLDALARTPDDLWLRHRAVLCLIRSGALERAEADYRRFRLVEARHNEDCLALGARLLKAIAFEAEATCFPVKAAAAASKYADVFEQTGGHYPGINAATMWLMAGDAAAAAVLARRVLEACRGVVPVDAEDAYYLKASEAEAYLLLGENGAANMALRAAISRDHDNYIARATTLRQLRLIVDVQGVSAPWIDALEPPRPAHFAGHLFRLGDGEGAVPPVREAELAETIAARLAAEKVGPVYGGMAAGADILVAEAALDAGCALTAVLPVPASVFIDASVRPFGAQWVRRCEACLEAASDIVEVTSDRQIVSELNLNHAGSVAMGMARIRADVLATHAVQLLIFDGDDSNPRFGTARDAAVWRATGQRQCIIPFDRTVQQNLSAPLPMPAERAGYSPAMRAMLFLDVRGSSTVPDDRVPTFVDHVVGRLANCCHALERPPVYADSWGDGLFLAFETVIEAAEAAVRLRREFADIDLDALDLPAALGLRIAGHCGPVHEGMDPIQKRTAPFGGQVAIAARIERATLPGSIFVSEPFAALLAMSEARDYRCEYVGQTEIDTLLPPMPLYSLRAVAPGSPASRRTTVSA